MQLSKSIITVWAMAAIGCFLLYGSDPCGGAVQASCLDCKTEYIQNCPNCSSSSEYWTYAGLADAATCIEALVPPNKQCSGKGCFIFQEPPLECTLKQLAYTVRCTDGSTKYYYTRRCCSFLPD